MRTKKIVSLIVLIMLLASPMASIIYGDTEDPEEEPETEPEEEEVPEEEEEETPEQEEEEPPEPEEEEELEDDEEEEELEEEGEGVDIEVLDQLYQNREQIQEQLRIHLMEEFGEFTSYEDLDGKVHQSIMNSLRHAEQAFEDVDNEKWSDPEASANQLQRGMKHFSNAMKQFSAFYYGEEEDDEEELEVEVEVPDDDEIKQHKRKLMFQYQENFQNRIQEMTDSMNQIMNQLNEGDQQKATNAIMNTIRKLERIQARLDQGDIDEAIDEAEDAEDEFEEALSTMENQQLSLMLKTMYKLGAKIQLWENKMEKKQGEGMDFTEEQNLVNQLRMALEEAKNDIESGNYVDAEGTLNQASENAKGKGKGKKGN